MSEWISYLKSLFFQYNYQEIILDYFKPFLIKEDLDYLENFLNDSEFKYLVNDVTLSFYDQFFLGYQKQKFIGHLSNLKNSLEESKILFKKILFWESQFEVLEKNNSYNLIKVVEKRKFLYNSLCEYFKFIKDKNILFKNIFENECQNLLNSNQTSLIPVETFDDILFAQEFNFIKLKSLFQLLKLLISELITSLIFIFFTFGSDSFKVLDNLTNFFNDLNNEIKIKNKNFNEEYFCLSLFLKNVDDLTKNNILKINDNQQIVLSEIKIIRTKIFSSLFLVDNVINNILENKYFFDEEENNFKVVLDNFKTSVNILDSLIKQNAKKNKVDTVKNLPQINLPLDIPKNEQISEEKEIEYQVFETYIDKQDKQTKSQIDYDLNLEEKNYSAPLFYELKEALVEKAKDRKEKEAKALGISVELLEKKFENHNNKSNNYKQEINKSLCFNQINIAKQVALEKKKIKFLVDEENFGD